MTAKEYLSQAYKMDRRVRLIELKIEKLRSLLECSSPSLEAAGAGKSADRMPDTVSKIMEYEQRAAELRSALIVKYLEIDQAIRCVTDSTQREVLERRYLLYQRWNRIAEEMNYSVDNVYKLHGKALQKITLNYSIDL
jgi:tRNA(Met) C34 N-acetyltransferase TmcA